MSLIVLQEGKYLVDLTWSEGGRRYRLRRQVFGSLKDAKEWERKLKNAVKMKQILRPEKKEKRQTFEEFAWEWFETYVKANNKLSEQRNKECHLRVHLLPCFGRFFLDEICRQDIEKYKAEAVSGGYAARTVNLHLACLQKLFQSAVDWERLSRNPCRGVKDLKERQDRWQFLDFEEAERFLRAVPERWYPLFLCAVRTGLRLGELLALRWEDVDFKRKMMTVKNSLSYGQLSSTKSYGVRQIILSADLFEVLWKLRGERISEFVFSTEEGRPLHRSSIKRPLNAAIKLSGVKRLRFHDLRHTFASHLVMAGAPVKAVQELLGHADSKMTQRYTHLSQACRNEAISLLENKLLAERCAKNVTLEPVQPVSLLQSTM